MPKPNGALPSPRDQAEKHQAALDYSNAYHAKNREARNAAGRKYHAKNRAATNAAKREYRAANPGSERAYNKSRYAGGRTEESVVYVVLEGLVTGASRPVVKVGKTKQLRSRLSMLQCGNPREIRLIATIPESDIDGGEGAVLRSLTPFRCRKEYPNSEWFFAEPELIEILIKFGFPEGIREEL